MSIESDGCTGFQWAHSIWPGIYDCCVAHDLGGSDGVLLDCLYGMGVPMVLAAFGVAVMVLFRPLYHLFKGRRGKP